MKYFYLIFFIFLHFEQFSAKNKVSILDGIDFEIALKEGNPKNIQKRQAFDEDVSADNGGETLRVLIEKVNEIGSRQETFYDQLLQLRDEVEKLREILYTNIRKPRGAELSRELTTEERSKFKREAELLNIQFLRLLYSDNWNFVRPDVTFQYDNEPDKGYFMRGTNEMAYRISGVIKRSPSFLGEMSSCGVDVLVAIDNTTSISYRNVKDVYSAVLCKTGIRIGDHYFYHFKSIDVPLKSKSTDQLNFGPSGCVFSPNGQNKDETKFDCIWDYQMEGAEYFEPNFMINIFKVKMNTLRKKMESTPISVDVEGVF